MTIPLDPESKLSSEGFEFRKSEASPFVVPVSEYWDISEENSVFFVEFRGIPCTSSGGIEEFTDNDWISISRLVSGFPEQFPEFIR